MSGKVTSTADSAIDMTDIKDQPAEAGLPAAKESAPVPQVEGEVAQGERTARQLWKYGAFKVQSSVGASMAFKTLRAMGGSTVVSASNLQHIKRLGEGAFGVVELAWSVTEDRTSKTMVAVKLLKPEVFNSPDDLQMFQKEAVVMQRISHPHLVRLLGVGEMSNSGEHGAAGGLASSWSQGMYLVQEYMSGGTLKHLVYRQQLTPHSRVYRYQDALRWCMHIAKGLNYLHSANPMIIHRDMKLENVLLSESNTSTSVAKVADFGLCTCIDHLMAKRPLRSATSGVAMLPSLTSVPELGDVTVDFNPPDSKPPAAGSPAISELQPPAPRVSSGSSQGTDTIHPLNADSPFAHSSPSRKGSFSLLQRSRSSSFRRTLSQFTRGLSVRASNPGDQVNGMELYRLSGGTGSMMYMAPEVYRREPYNSKVDVFAFSFMMLEVFMGMVLATFMAPRGWVSEVEEFARRVAEEDFRPSIPDRVPDSITQLIRDCWAHNPADRLSMEEVLRRLRDIEVSGEMQEVDRLTKSGGCSCLGGGR